MTAEISEYIRQHEAVVAPLYKDYSLKFWQLSLSGNAENEKALVAAKTSAQVPATALGSRIISERSRLR